MAADPRAHNRRAPRYHPPRVDLLPWELAALLALGLAAGVLGGLLGIGGSVIMIPVMALLFERRPWGDQHLFQASAMVVNIAVALPAMLRHRRAAVLRRGVVRVLLPATLVFIVVGVLLANTLSSPALRQLFAVFLVYVGLSTAWKVFTRRPDHEAGASTPTIARLGSVGAITGTTAGLLGVGGGVVSVPLMQALCRLPLKEAIAASASVMVFSSALGATLKLATLDRHGQAWTLALLISACLAPTALVGGHLGAILTHRLPVHAIRAVFSVVVLVIAARLLGLF